MQSFIILSEIDVSVSMTLDIASGYKYVIDVGYQMNIQTKFNSNNFIHLDSYWNKSVSNSANKVPCLR